MSKLIKLLPASGFAIAVALVSITSAFKNAQKGKDDTVMFHYVPPTSDPTYSASNVQNVDNWVATTVDPGCDNIDTKACTITVPDDDQYVDRSGDEPKLQSNFGIQTSGTSVAYVSGTDAQGSATVVNKSN